MINQQPPPPPPPAPLPRLFFIRFFLKGRRTPSGADRQQVPAQEMWGSQGRGSEVDVLGRAWAPGGRLTLAGSEDVGLCPHALGKVRGYIDLGAPSETSCSLGSPQHGVKPAKLSLWIPRSPSLGEAREHRGNSGQWGCPSGGLTSVWGQGPQAQPQPSSSSGQHP